jgi:biopolymer transport protein TolR
MYKLNAAPLAAMFAILIVMVVTACRVPTGQAVQIATPPGSAACEGDGRIVVAHVQKDSHVRLNSETVDLVGLDARLREIYGSRAERVLFVRADSEVPFQKIAEVIDIAKRQIEVVAILTPSVEKQPCWKIRWPAPIEWLSTGRQAPRWR